MTNCTTLQQKQCKSADADGLVFLSSAGDAEVRRFLRWLPIFAANNGGPITLRDLSYEMRLQPFVMNAFDKLDGSPGIPGRLLQLN